MSQTLASHWLRELRAHVLPALAAVSQSPKSQISPGRAETVSASVSVLMLSSVSPCQRRSARDQVTLYFRYQLYLKIFKWRDGWLWSWSCSSVTMFSDNIVMGEDLKDDPWQWPVSHLRDDGDHGVIRTRASRMPRRGQGDQKGWGPILLQTQFHQPRQEEAVLKVGPGALQRPERPQPFHCKEDLHSQFG